MKHEDILKAVEKCATVRSWKINGISYFAAECCGMTAYWSTLLNDKEDIFSITVKDDFNLPEINCVTIERAISCLTYNLRKEGSIS